jgi:hypothetical protein
LGLEIVGQMLLDFLLDGGLVVGLTHFAPRRMEHVTSERLGSGFSERYL